jgi:hypothetical protein
MEHKRISPYFSRRENSDGSPVEENDDFSPVLASLDEIRLMFAKPEPSDPATPPRENTAWMHKDGGIYEVLMTALDTTTGHLSVVYEHVWPFTGEGYPSHQRYVRPFGEWHERFERVNGNAVSEMRHLPRSHYQTLVAEKRTARKAAEHAALYPTLEDEGSGI